MEAQALTSARVAESAGVGVETVRNYERRRLIRQPSRERGTIRRYGPAHVERIRFIRRSQELGFTLDEIASLLELQDGTDRRSVRRIAAARLEQIEARIADLARIRRALKHAIEECEHGKTPACPIIEALNGARASAR